MAVRLFCLLLLTLAFVSPGFMQTEGVSVRFDTPDDLPANRIPFTEENFDDRELLAIWGFGIFENTQWLMNNRILVTSNIGTWLFDTAQPQRPIANFVLHRDLSTLVYFDVYYTAYDVPRLPSPDGLSFYSAAYDGIIDIETGARFWVTPISFEEPRLNPDSYPHAVTAFRQWLPNGRFVTATSTEIAIWDSSVQPAELYAYVAVPPSDRTTYTIEHMTVSPDQRTMILVVRSNISDQLLVQLVDLTTGEFQLLYADDLLPTVRLNPDGLQFNEDGSEVAMALSYRTEASISTVNNEVWRWDTRTYAALDTYTLSCQLSLFNYVRDYGICRSHFSVQESEPGMVRLSTGAVLWDQVGGSLAIVASRTDSPQHYIIISSLQSRASDSSLSAVILNDQGQVITTLTSDEIPRNISFSPDSTHVALTFPDRIEILEIAQPEQRVIVQHPVPNQFGRLEITPDQQSLLVGTYSTQADTPQVVRISLETGAYEIIPELEGNVSLRYSPDGSILIGYREYEMNVYDAQTLALEATVYNNSAIQNVEFSPDGRVLAMLGREQGENDISFWDTVTWQVVNRVDAGRDNRLHFTSDSGWLIQDGTIWKVENRGQLVARWLLEDASAEVQVFFEPGSSLEFYANPFDLPGGGSIILGNDILAVERSEGAIELFGIAAEEGE